MIFTGVFLILTSPTLATELLEPTYGPTDINELSKRYLKEASALGIYDFNNYDVRVVKNYGELTDLATYPKSFKLEKGTYRITSYLKDEFLGQQTKKAPEFTYLQITPSYYEILVWENFTNLKKLEAENYFYVAPDDDYKFELLDLRKTQEKYEKFDDEFTSDDVKLALEKVELTPAGSIWFVDKDIELVLGSSKLKNYVEEGGTIVKYADLDKDFKLETHEKGKYIFLSSALQTLSSEELEFKLSRLQQLQNFVPDQEIIELALTFMIGVLVILLVFVPFKPRLPLKFKPIPRVDFFEKFSVVTGLMPIQSIKLFVALGLVFAGIFYVLQLLPLASVVTNEANYIKEGDWYRFRSSADFLTIGVPNITPEVSIKADFISDDAIYAKSGSSARTFRKNVSLVRVPGIDFDELFMLAEKPGKEEYETYVNPKSPSESDFVFDVETLNKREFIIEELIFGQKFDRIFTQVPVRFGDNRLKVNLRGFEEFGLFLATVEETNFNGKVNVELAAYDVNSPSTSIENVGGKVAVYDIASGLVSEQNLVAGQNSINLSLPSGVYYLDFFSYGGELDSVTVDSSTTKFAGDWRLFGRERLIYSAKCSEQNDFILVRQDWVSDHRAVDRCAYDAWLSADNQLTTMFTADIYNVFLDTVVLPTSDVVVTNRDTALPPNENLSIFILYTSSLGNFDFENKFSLKKIVFDYEKN